MFMGAADLEDVNSPPIRHKCDIFKKQSKLSDRQVFGCNILTNRTLATKQLSGNCLDGLLMRGNEVLGHLSVINYAH